MTHDGTDGEIGVVSLSMEPRSEGLPLHGLAVHYLTRWAAGHCSANSVDHLLRLPFMPMTSMPSNTVQSSAGLATGLPLGRETEALRFSRDLATPTIAELITSYVDPNDPSVVVLPAPHLPTIVSVPPGSAAAIFYTPKINSIRYVNKFLEAANAKLRAGGLLIGCVETMEQRRERMLGKLPKVLCHPARLLDFVFNRVLPKSRPTRRFYFWVTGGRNRALSLAETLGRLVSCGFDILDFEEIDKRTYVVAKKIAAPSFDMRPTYGLFCRLKRVGQGGKIMRVYKLRTMHPYGEYLQEYISKNHRLKAGGKFKEDFRITAWGKMCRRYWVDELPMLINWMRREVKFVGVRPLSWQRFSLYPEDVRELRARHKPGLVPPLYADLPATFEEIVECERRYLLAYERNPVRTDLRYLARAVWNIVFKRARGDFVR